MIFQNVKLHKLKIKVILSLNIYTYNQLVGQLIFYKILIEYFHKQYIHSYWLFKF